MTQSESGMNISVYLSNTNR